MPNYGGHCIVPLDEERDLQVAVQARVDQLRARGDIAEANRVLDAYVALRADLDALATRMAVRGTEILRRHERDSRVRPDTAGLGGKRLEDYLVCEPIQAFGVHGAVGIANYDLLDAEVSWWWTQEQGYKGNVGRVVFGAFFEPGPETRPDPVYDQQHAIFEPRASAGQRIERAEVSGGEVGKRGSMEIQKAIRAKHFLEPAAREIEAEWQVGFQAAKAAYIAAVAPIP